MASFFRAFTAVGSHTMLSRILGFVRDLVFAHWFGASAATDAFFVAFKIPNFLRRLFAEGSFSVAFVPILTEYRTKRNKLELQTFTDRMAGSLGLVVLLVSLVGVVAAPILVMIFAPGFWNESEGKYELTVEMLTLTFPYLFFITMTAFAGSILNTYNRFWVPAFTPVLLNLSLIGCAIWLSPMMERPIVALAWGVLIAGIVQFMFQLPFLWRVKLFPRPRVGFKDPGVVRVMRLMVPALFGVSVSQINLLLDTLIASFLVSGSISWLYYSDRLMEFPVGVLGVALGTVILPTLSRRHAENSPQAFSHTLDWALRLNILFGLPAAVGLFLLAGPMLATLFFSDAFDHHDVEMATRSLMAYAPGLMAIMLIKVLAPGFYGRQDTKTPVRIGVIAMSVNMVLNIILVFPLAHAGLALATTISSGLNAYLLFRALITGRIYSPAAGWAALLLRVLLASLAMGIFIWWGAGDISEWLAGSGTSRVWWLAGLIASAIMIYFLTLFLLGARPGHFRSVKR
ncbi:MAG: murein biosynthesis integral membrane protein MurJ [Candidatus Thiodiazotropha endolucinida]|nr:murein biosynthesis integral membrane protein MurJ [Candidatus Thiodiazotropha endolucinida]MCW4248252.1 murein biosynthesis integral membrane protein MurJ [Candidatus Thiodiazotropha endolucinida]MCW4260362.1 murein biosynthesis integral membrane protein MurJ [Candidatus Thiodiazotropha endolucinida]MCW4265352.1 murein biosynthesis integral membrane protein MurJ [Candidatus Thiodiazotropha endolucinida]MCW4269774.1 murein biosynthesis integral membrane protein MurJ [Candidatus Thiodiazotrop